MEYINVFKTIIIATRFILFKFAHPCVVFVCFGYVIYISCFDVLNSYLYVFIQFGGSYRFLNFDNAAP